MVCDDSVVIRRLVADVLAADPEIEVVGTAVNGKNALDKLPTLSETCPVIILTAFATIDHAVEAIRRGAIFETVLEHIRLLQKTKVELGKTTPLLGVCLGMQGIAHFFGGQVVRANVPMHGKTSPIRHDGQGVYQGLPQQLDIMRYHSLMVDAASLPECLVVTSVVSSEQHSDKNLKDASLAGDEIMGIRHRDYPIQGVQYHPESFATEGAKMLLKNFLWHN